MYFISNIFLRIRGGSKSSCTNAIFFALVQELIDRPSFINEQLLEHDAYISCLQLKKVNVAHDAMHNIYLYNHTAYYHVLQQVIAFLVIYEPRCEKTVGLRGFRPCPTQTRLCSHRRWLEA